MEAAPKFQAQDFESSKIFRPRLKQRLKCDNKDARKMLKETLSKLKDVDQDMVSYFVKPEWDLIDPDMKKILDTYCTRKKNKVEEEKTGRVHELFEDLDIFLIGFKDFEVATTLMRSKYKVICPMTLNGICIQEAKTEYPTCKTCFGPMEHDPKQWNYCDWCRGNDCQYRCNSCDCDICEKCYKKNTKVTKQQATVSLYVKLSSGMFSKDEKDVEKPIQTLLKASAKYLTCTLEEKELAFQVDLKDSDNAKQDLAMLMKQIKVEKDLFGKGQVVDVVSLTTPLVRTMRYQRNLKLEALRRELTIPLETVAEYLKHEGFDVLTIDDVNKAPIKDDDIVALVGRPRGKLTKTLFESCGKFCENAGASRMNPLFVGHGKTGVKPCTSQVQVRMLYEPDTIAKAIVKHSLAIRDSRKLDALQKELDREEHRRENRQSELDKEHGTALNEVRSYREKLERVIEARVEILKKTLNKVGGGSSDLVIKSSNSSVETLALRTAMILLTCNDVADDDSKTKDNNEDVSILNAEIEHLQRVKLSATVMANVSFSNKKLLNLTHDWLLTFFPHCMKKINRVSFGLLNGKDCERALEKDPLMPRTRLKLAVRICTIYLYLPLYPPL
jgi:hypothetical protein